MSKNGWAMPSEQQQREATAAARTLSITTKEYRLWADIVYHIQQEQRRGERKRASMYQYIYCKCVSSPWDVPAQHQRDNTGICFLVDAAISRINSIHIGLDIGITSDEALTWHTAAPGSLRYTLSWRLQLLDPHQASAISQLHQARSHRTARRRSA